MSRSVGFASHLQCMISKLGAVGVYHNLLWTPILDNPSKKDLLGVVCNVWLESIYCSTPVTVRALNELRGCHSCFEWLKYFCEANMI